MQDNDLISRTELLKHKCDCYDQDYHLLYAVPTGYIVHAPAVQMLSGVWDYQITAESDMWVADAVCPCCGFTKQDIWSGWFPSIPADIARSTTLTHAKRVWLPRYCENCGAHLEGKNEQL